MSNSVDSDETAYDEPSHLDLCCLQKPIIIACGSERVNCIHPLPGPLGELSYRGPGFESHWRRNSTHGCKALHCIEHFVATRPYLDKTDIVEWVVKHQIITSFVSTSHS